MSYPNWIEEDRIHRVDDVLASPAKSDTPSTCHLSIVPADQELNTGWKNEMSERGYTFSFGKSVDDVRGTGVKQHLQFLDSLLSQGVRLSGCEEKYASEARSLFPMSADGSMDTTNVSTRIEDDPADRLSGLH